MSDVRINMTYVYIGI